ncbi:MAG: hypothetical protein ACOX0Z_03550 [Candidatus Nanosyncoccaceae bacterium]|jgi:hypothetical protein
MIGDRLIVGDNQRQFMVSLLAAIEKRGLVLDFSKINDDNIAQLEYEIRKFAVPRSWVGKMFERDERGRYSVFRSSFNELCNDRLLVCKIARLEYIKPDSKLEWIADSIKNDRALLILDYFLDHCVSALFSPPLKKNWWQRALSWIFDLDNA